MLWRKKKSLECIRYASASDRGKVRTENQDFYGAFLRDSDNPNETNGHLFVVADGMGGHAGGRHASELAVHSIEHAYFNMTPDSLRNDLRKAIENANARVHQESTNGPYRGMGTTCTALAIRNGEGCIGHVGDSRAYRIDEAGIHQLTDDHTHVAMLYRQGLLTLEEAQTHPRRSMLTRALGGEAEVVVDMIDLGPLEFGQYFLLCSDGLAPVTCDEIHGIVTQFEPQNACAKLINLTNERGSPDNVTVQIIYVDKPKRFLGFKNGRA
jgi:protein phosphatase